MTKTSRRRFLATTAAAATGAALPALAIENAIEVPTFKNRIYKSVKWGMIQEPVSVLEKFQLMQSLGYDGMELVGPGPLDAAEVRAASEKTGMPVHGVVDQRHWRVRLSDPDPKRRRQSRTDLEACLKECATFGGDSVLLVPGKVTGPDETHDHVWKRSIVEIRKTLPLAARLGVRVLIENVWNGFCETPEQLRDYLDEINSPWVGAYFDIGNVQKFSPSEQWINVLGSRIVKLDVKDWGKRGGFGKIGDGDVNWPAVRKALDAISFTGWCTAEVRGGNKARLADIATRMNTALAL